MSVPPPSSSVPPPAPGAEAPRELLVRLEEPRGWAAAESASADALRFSPRRADRSSTTGALPAALRAAGVARARHGRPGPGQGRRHGRPPARPAPPLQDRRRAARGGHRGLAVDQPRRQRAARRSPRTTRPTARCSSPSRSPATWSPRPSRPIGSRRSPPARRSASPSVPGLLLRVADTVGRAGGVPPLRHRAAADRPRGAAGDAALAADRHPRRSGDPRARARIRGPPPRWRRPAWARPRACATVRADEHGRALRSRALPGLPRHRQGRRPARAARRPRCRARGARGPAASSPGTTPRPRAAPLRPDVEPADAPVGFDEPDRVDPRGRRR